MAKSAKYTLFMRIVGLAGQSPKIVALNAAPLSHIFPNFSKSPHSLLDCTALVACIRLVSVPHHKPLP